MEYQYYGDQNAPYITSYQQVPLPSTPGHQTSDSELRPQPQASLALDFYGSQLNAGFEHAGVLSHSAQSQQPHTTLNPDSFAAFGQYGASAAATVSPMASIAPVHNAPPTPPNHPFAPLQSGIDRSTVQSHVLDMPSTLEGLSPEDPSPLHPSAGSGDDDLTPAQSRRKAQNRAAQRAFRERKEKHVKDLEAQLSQYQSSDKEKSDEVARLKMELQKLNTEIEILKATTTHNGLSNTAPQTIAMLDYNPTDFYSDLLSIHTNKTPSHRIVMSENGQKLYAAGAAWEYIMAHDLTKQGRVDITFVSDRLKTQAKCDGQGPVFEEGAIREAIEASALDGSDSLL